MFCSTIPAIDCSPRRRGLWLVQPSCGCEWLTQIVTWWTLVAPKIYAFPIVANRSLWNNVQQLSVQSSEEEEKKFSLILMNGHGFKFFIGQNVIKINLVLWLGATYRNFSWKPHTNCCWFLFRWAYKKINQIKCEQQFKLKFNLNQQKKNLKYKCVGMWSHCLVHVSFEKTTLISIEKRFCAAIAAVDRQRMLKSTKIDC